VGSYVNYVNYGVKILRTQDISAPSDLCRSVRTVGHSCQSVSRTVSTSSKHYWYNRPYRRKERVPL